MRNLMIMFLMVFVVTFTNAQTDSVIAAIDTTTNCVYTFDTTWQVSERIAERDTNTRSTCCELKNIDPIVKQMGSTVVVERYRVQLVATLDFPKRAPENMFITIEACTGLHFLRSNKLHEDRETANAELMYWKRQGYTPMVKTEYHFIPDVPNAETVFYIKE